MDEYHQGMDGYKSVENNALYQLQSEIEQLIVNECARDENYKDPLRQFHKYNIYAILLNFFQRGKHELAIYSMGKWYIKWTIQRGHWTTNLPTKKFRLCL